MSTYQEIIAEILALRTDLNTYKGQVETLVGIINTKKELLEEAQNLLKSVSAQIDAKFKELRGLI